MSALDRSGRRATLETGGIRVTVDLEDLELVDGGDGADGREGRQYSGGSAARGEAGAGTNVGALRLARARTVPMSLDLRGARVDEALGALGTYLEDASLAGLERVTVIHGLGTGALRDAVRSESAAHPLVTSIRAGEKGEGRGRRLRGPGPTVVSGGHNRGNFAPRLILAGVVADTKRREWRLVAAAFGLPDPGCVEADTSACDRGVPPGPSGGWQRR